VEVCKESAARPEEATQSEHMTSVESMPAITQPANIEQIAKLAAGIVLLMYVTGLFAVNAYLFTLGASDFSLVRTRFIYTGTLIWASLFLANVPILISLYMFRTVPGSHPSAPLPYMVRIIMRLMMLGGSFAFALSVFFIVVSIVPSASPNSRLRVSIILTGWAIGAGLGIWIILLGRRLPATAPSLLQLGQTAIVGVWIVAILIAYTGAFMSLAYSRIPEQYGGGRPREIRLLVAKEDKQGLEELEIAFSGKGQLSDLVTLLYEGEEQYILRSRNGHVVRVKKDLVVGTTP
jgi:hypothetical protein